MSIIIRTRERIACIAILSIASQPSWSQATRISIDYKVLTEVSRNTTVASDAISIQFRNGIRGQYQFPGITDELTTETVFAETSDPLAERKSNSLGKELTLRSTGYNYPPGATVDIGITSFPIENLLLYAEMIKGYARENGFDTTYVLLGNLGMKANRKRLFLVNIETMQVEMSGLVSSGRGKGSSVFAKTYSNTPGSRCTSLGRYKISSKYSGNYGVSYRMVGLDPSNRNALDRHIVFHSMHCIPDYEGCAPACVSDGCPAVSPKYFASLMKLIDTRKNPVLMWIFDSNLETIE